MNSIFLIARFFIHEGETNEFKRIAAEMIKLVEDKETDTLQYDWYFNKDGTECAVLEKYTGPEAVMAHLGNVGELLGQLMEIADFKAEIFGELSEELLNAAAELNIKNYFFLEGI